MQSPVLRLYKGTQQEEKSLRNRQKGQKHIWSYLQETQKNTNLTIIT